MMKKRIWLFSFLLTMMLLLTACGSELAETAATPTATTAVSTQDTENDAETVTNDEDADTEETEVLTDSFETETEDIAETTEDAFTEDASDETEAAVTADSDSDEDVIDEDGWYYSKDEVALYIHTYGKLPSNYITKKEAEALGWTGGSVQVYKEGAAIGGSKFGNYEGLLPSGHTYYECDIDTDGKSSRGAKRIIFSTDGLIYYTDDHYETFTQLY